MSQSLSMILQCESYIIELESQVQFRLETYTIYIQHETSYSQHNYVLGVCI